MAYRDPNKAYVSFYNVAGADGEDTTDFEFDSWTGDSMEVDLSLVQGSDGQELEQMNKNATEPVKPKKIKKKDPLA
jgi:hypothetical protein